MKTKLIIACLTMLLTSVRSVYADHPVLQGERATAIVDVQIPISTGFFTVYIPLSILEQIHHYIPW